jgi:hypothetical protein
MKTWQIDKGFRFIMLMQHGYLTHNTAAIDVTTLSNLLNEVHQWMGSELDALE